MKWTPYDIRMMLHFYSTGERFPQFDAPIYGERLAQLMQYELVEFIDGIPRATKLGEAFIELLLQTPIPVAVYVDPRFKK